MSKQSKLLRKPPNAKDCKLLTKSLYLMIESDKRDNIPCHCELAVRGRVFASKMTYGGDSEMQLSILLGAALEEIKRLQSLVEHG